MSWDTNRKSHNIVLSKESTRACPKVVGDDRRVDWIIGEQSMSTGRHCWVFKAKDDFGVIHYLVSG